MRVLKRVLVFLLMLCGGVLAYIAAFVFLVFLGATLFDNIYAFSAGVRNLTSHSGETVATVAAPSWVRPTGVVIMCIFTVAGFLTPYRLIHRRLRKP